METMIYPKSLTWHLTRQPQTGRPVTIAKVSFDHAAIQVSLSDGRSINVPLSWFPALENAAQTFREVYEIHPEGTSVSWPELSLQVTLRELMTGSDPCGQCWFRVSYYK